MTPGSIRTQHREVPEGLQDQDTPEGQEGRQDPGTPEGREGRQDPGTPEGQEGRQDPGTPEGRDNQARRESQAIREGPEGLEGQPSTTEGYRNDEVTSRNDCHE